MAKHRASRRVVPVLIVLALMLLAGVSGALLVSGHGLGNSSSSTNPANPSGPSNPNASLPVTGATGYLHTSGVHLLSSSGQVVQLTGLNVEGLESTNPQGSSVPGQCHSGWKPLTASEVKLIAGYGFNSVRLPISWGNIEPVAPSIGANGSLVHHWNSAYVTALKDEIALFGQSNIQVVLDMHQSTWGPAFLTPPYSKKPSCPGGGMPVWLNPNAASETVGKASCGFLANQGEPGVPGTPWSDFIAAETYIDGVFANNPTVVGQDVINEPFCGQGIADLNGFYAAVAPAIHKVNPNILIILEDKEDPGTYLLSQVPNVPNVVLSTHLHQDYWTAPTAGQKPLAFSGQAALEANVQRSVQFNVPLYIGEFYVFDGTNSQNKNSQADATWVSDTASFLAYARQHDLSWAFWSWLQKKHPEIQPTFSSAAHSALKQ